TDGITGPAWHRAKEDFMDVAVIGAGTMGSGIAQVCASAGHDVSLHDTSKEQLDRAVTAIRSSLDRFVAKNKLAADEAEKMLDRIAVVPRLADAVGAAHVVIESVVELLDVKQDIFRSIVAAAPGDALLGTNTSQLSVTGIGS